MTASFLFVGLQEFLARLAELEFGESSDVVTALDDLDFASAEHFPYGSDMVLHSIGFFSPWMKRTGALHALSSSSVTPMSLKLRPTAANALTSLLPYKNLAIAFAWSSVGFGLPGRPRRHSRRGRGISPSSLHLENHDLVMAGRVDRVAGLVQHGGKKMGR